jgi:PKD repeat protein
MLAQMPTIPASNLKIVNLRCNQFDVTWTNGNGAQRIVFVREKKPLKYTPDQDEYYISNSVFGMGEAIVSDSDYCVYKGTGSSCTVTGLKKNTRYYVGVFEFNTNPPNYQYLTTSFPKRDTITRNMLAKFEIDRPIQCLNGNNFKYINKSVSENDMSFKWLFGDNETSTDSNTTHSYKNYGIYHVKLIVQSIGCTDTAFNYDTVNPHPVVNFQLDPLIPNNDSIQCLYQNEFIFKNNTKFPSLGGLLSSARYIWSSDNFKGTGYKSSITFLSSGTKRVKLVAETNNGCKDSIQQIYFVKRGSIDPALVTVSPKKAILSGNSFQFTNTNSPATSHKWYIQRKGLPGFLDSSSNTTFNYSFKDSGTYIISLKASDIVNGCSDLYKDSIYVFSGTGKVKGIKHNQVSVFPNPSLNGFFTLNGLSPELKITVLDAYGKMLFVKYGSDNEPLLDLSKYGKGSYFLQIQSPQGISYLRLTSM